MNETAERRTLDAQVREASHREIEAGHSFGKRDLVAVVLRDNPGLEESRVLESVEAYFEELARGERDVTPEEARQHAAELRRYLEERGRKRDEGSNV
jgi:hypothetical protein